MEIKGPVNLLELQTKCCCLSEDFSGEMVQGVHRFLKTSLTQKEIRIPRSSVIVPKTQTFSEHRLIIVGIEWILLCLLTMISLN